LCTIVFTKELFPTKNGVEEYLKAVEANANSKQEVSPFRSFVTPSGVSITLHGRTALADPGSHQRIIDVVGPLASGVLTNYVILSSEIEAEIMSDGISSYDYMTNQAYFSSDGAYGGTVFYADLTKLAAIPPAAYYLSPVVYLGYDPVSGSRLIAGINTPAKNFLVMDKPNWGKVTLFQIPSALVPTASDAFDGTNMNYYSISCTGTGKCNQYIWNLGANNVTSFPLSCLASTDFPTGNIFVNGTSGTVYALVDSVGDAYMVMTVNVKAKTCTLTPLTNLPPKPVIIIAVQRGYKSGYLYLSVTSDVYNSINIYDENLKPVSEIKTQNLYEDIFVQEN